MSGHPVGGPTLPEHDLLVLAGGGGTRLGGVDKAALVVGGRPLLDRVLDASEGARCVVVVGPVLVPEGVLQTMEDPPGGGPVAGIVTGMAALARGREPAPWTIVLAVDQPEAAEAVPDLLATVAATGSAVDLVCPRDATGHPQWLLAAYRTRTLAARVDQVGTGHGLSVRRLVSGLRSAGASATHVGDIDTWEDHATWQTRVGGVEGV